MGERQSRSGRWLAAGAVLAWVLAAAGPAAADEAATTGEAPALRLPEELVLGDRLGEPFLPPVQGTAIYAGKKTTVTEPGELPQIVNESYRQLLYRTPSLLLSEETTPLLSLGYRGLEPHRAQFTQVLKDGIPIHADMFGYPEAYYTPPFDALERVEFIRGGASLLYGPQPGGALNFVTWRPPADRRFSLTSRQTFGTDNFYATYNALAGTVDRTGYYVYYYQRQGDGFRDSNSDFGQYSGSAKVTYGADTGSRWTLSFDGYSEEHGEPGGLARNPGENAITFSQDRDATTRKFDRFRLERYVPWLRWERDLSPDTLLQLTTWGGYYSRFSKRQRGGGFGTLPTGEAAQTNTIERQEFYTTGVEGRLRHDWALWDDTQTLTAGLLYYRADSPRVDKRGSTPDADDGAVRTKAGRRTDYVSVFAEQRFVFGRLSVTPGGRLENFWQTVRERVNVDKAAAGVPLSNADELDFEPVGGLGIAYDVQPEIQVYTNVSRAYRPKIFTQAVSQSPAQVVDGDLAPGQSWQYEIGFRGEPTAWAYWDTSLFFLDFTDQIGVVSQDEGPDIVRNVGRSQHKGWEAAAEVDLMGLHDALRGADLSGRFGGISVYGTVMLLDAELVRGPFKGNTPQYAPDHLIRTGVRYGWRDRFKAALLGTIVDRHFSDDNNRPERAIPGYTVWDLTFEGGVYRDLVALHFGVNNVFNQNYFARVRGDGIDPAYRRNFYGGVRVSF
jgi:Fe(3+) dicitrate transport protein